MDTPALLAQLQATYPTVSLWLEDRADGRVVISKIIIPPAERGHGTGTAVMHAICESADRTHTTLTLTPSPDFGGSVRRLRAFYRRFGFEPNHDYAISDTMVRYPR